MEKVFQEYAMTQEITKFNLVRYGNVLGSTGSVIQVWRQMEKEGTVYATDPDMSRFWLTADDAVDVILHAMDDSVFSGVVVIPKCGACTMEKLALYTLKTTPEYTGIRPGEKRYEELLGKEESRYAISAKGRIYLYPTTSELLGNEWEFTSKTAGTFFAKDIKKMIGE
jgi:FlaA1/EpsC-like NDP-sugar epimerase